jgi:hypothetical protein
VPVRQGEHAARARVRVCGPQRIALIVLACTAARCFRASGRPRRRTGCLRSSRTCWRSSASCTQSSRRA